MNLIEVWTKWFEERLNGGQVPQGPELVRVDRRGDLIGPRAVNAKIAQLRTGKSTGRSRGPTGARRRPKLYSF
jgi:hypothetical protein